MPKKPVIPSQIPEKKPEILFHSHCPIFLIPSYSFHDHPRKLADALRDTDDDLRQGFHDLDDDLREIGDQRDQQFDASHDDLVDVADQGVHDAGNDLRDGFDDIVATVLLEDGTPLNTVQELLGHYNPAFTATQYGHVTKKMRSEATVKLGNMLRAAKPNCTHSADVTV
jgi:integrase